VCGAQHMHACTLNAHPLLLLPLLLLLLLLLLLS
jgi:hypothetical protein